jgi:hypothetical protein
VSADSPDAARSTDAAEARRAIRAAAEAIVAGARAADPGLAEARLVGIGWATVELDRAVRELGAALGVDLRPVVGPREAALGASQRVATEAGLGFRLVLLEPDTEGPLAGLLARHGEGVVAAYVDVEGRSLRLELTNGPGGRPPRAVAARLPWAVG